MTTRIKTFLLEPTEHERLWLRRYVFSDREKCPGPSGYHSAMTLIGEEPIVWCETPESTQLRRVIAERSSRQPAADDPRWPVKCEHCDYLFTPDGEYQLFGRQLYRRQDTGEIMTLDDAPDGAMWYADWMRGIGPDGRYLMARVPGGSDWAIDGRASNCDMPDDNEHRCWVRHGEPPNITVDKNGNTCHAGGGSIQTSNWHGHLVNGEFIPC